MTQATNETAPTVVEALARVMGEVQSVRKEQKNTSQNYVFRGIDAVVNAVGPALRAHGVVAVPVYADQVSDYYDTKNGTRMRNVTLTVTWRFYGPAGDFIECMTIGEAADAGDKGMPKAHSVAYRILLLQALCIPTDDPDPDSESHERATPAAAPAGPQGFPLPKSWSAVKEAIVSGYGAGEQVYADFEAFLAAASEHLHGRVSLRDMTQEQRGDVLRKAAHAAVYVRDHCDDDVSGPSLALLREAWASVLGGFELPMPEAETGAVAGVETTPTGADESSPTPDEAGES